MTNREAVSLIDSTAKFCAWGEPVHVGGGEYTQPGWVNGSGWETKICSGEPRAWQVAVETLIAKAVAA